MSSSVAWACNPSGDAQVGGTCGIWSEGGRNAWHRNVARPAPSRELLPGHPSKEGCLPSGSVRRRGPREAGFTEQRLPPAPYSGRTTRRLPLSPAHPPVLPILEPQPFGPKLHCSNNLSQFSIYSLTSGSTSPTPL